MNYFNFKRRHSSIVHIGNTPLGGEYPIRIQSMTNTSTMDTEGSVKQCISIIEAGADYVRLTAQGVREAENLENIKKGLLSKGYQTPLIADIHFNPKAADAAAAIVDKVRINPGNFVDSARTFKKLTYTDEEYAHEIQRIRDRLVPFLNICKKHGTAIRLGVNHGSLSDRIMSRYGDTPEGMVESCLEFLRICREESFSDIVISIKASNTVIMVKTVRLLIEAMRKENMCYPLHLGVTEAGDGEDGRIKSAVGIGTLLADGIGDTIRVSLSEDPEKEIPVAKKLVDYIEKRAGHPRIEGETAAGFDYCHVNKRETQSIGNIGGNNPPVVIASCIPVKNESNVKADYYYTHKNCPSSVRSEEKIIVDADVYRPQENVYPLFKYDEISLLKAVPAPLRFLEISYNDATPQLLKLLKEEKNIVLILSSAHQNIVGEQRAFFHWLINNQCSVPVILKNRYNENNAEELQIKTGADFGPLLMDYFGDGILIQNDGDISPKSLISYSFGILQATRQRITKTEYISCPSCGRTMFDLQQTIARVKAATSHLTGLKIGIMGCIVNGPGEMADADYGYVGAGRHKVSLYKGKECIEKNIPEEEAIEKLTELIRKNNDWKGKE